MAMNRFDDHDARIASTIELALMVRDALALADSLGWVDAAIGLEKARLSLLAVVPEGRCQTNFL